MKDSQLDKVKAILNHVRQQPPEKRLAYLEQIGAGDQELLAEVKRQLETSENAERATENLAAGDVIRELGRDTVRFESFKKLGHYEIVKQIGLGGMGEVYLASDKILDRQVAIKILNADFSRHETNLQRFKKEAKAASSLNHPNILVIHEIGETEGTNYIVSEYVEGQTLREIIRKNPLNVESILDLSIQIANALSAAHLARIVHRDIKPENIMVRPDGYVKILDFGLAKLLQMRNADFGMRNEDNQTFRQSASDNQQSAIQNPHSTTPGLILGTVAYMSPEQAHGEAVDEKADIFSFGVVLYEMITRRNPFAGNSIPETFANLLTVEPVPLNRLISNVPVELQRIVSRMLQKDKSARYQSVRELLADLKSLEKRLVISADLEISKNSADRDQTQILFDLSDQANHSPLNSIAVLPFTNMSSDAENEYFCDGLAEELLNALSKLKNLRVAARISAFSFKGKNLEISEIGRKLNVQKIVEGSVRKIGNRVRISVQLINATDGYQLWSERYDLELRDIFEIQDEITLAVVAALRVNLESGDKSALLKRYADNVEAYEYLLKGNFYFYKRNLAASPDMDVAMEMYKKAIEIDPNYALAHARLAYCYLWKAVYTDAENPKWIKLAESQLEKVESINPQLPQLFEVRSEIFWSKYRNFDIPAAVQKVLQVRRVYPRAGHLQMAIFAFHCGVEDVADREFNLAFEIDPSDDFVAFASVDAYSLFGDYEKAYQIGKPYGIDANGFVRALLGLNRIAEAAAAVNESLAKAPKNNRRQGEKVLVLATQGKFAEAEELILQISQNLITSQAYHHATYDFACAYALNGKAPEAVKWLAETFETGMPIYNVFERDPNLDRIRQTPEFIEFMQAVKPQWEKTKQAFDQLRG